MTTINKPYKKTLDENGKVIDTFPYESGVSNRQLRRGNQRISVNTLGQVVIQRRVKSSKRKRDWV